MRKRKVKSNKHITTCSCASSIRPIRKIIKNNGTTAGCSSLAEQMRKSMQRTVLTDNDRTFLRNFLIPLCQAEASRNQCGVLLDANNPYVKAYLSKIKLFCREEGFRIEEDYSEYEGCDNLWISWMSAEECSRYYS